MEEFYELIPSFLTADFAYLQLVVIFCGLLIAIFFVIGFHFLFLKRDPVEEDLQQEVEYEVAKGALLAEHRETFLKLRADKQSDIKQKLQELDTALADLIEAITALQNRFDYEFEAPPEVAEVRDHKAKIFSNLLHVPYPYEQEGLVKRYLEVLESLLY